ncbi:MAG: peroxiredoxin-like family protein [Candidatus Aquilonibacter sp.]
MIKTTTLESRLASLREKYASLLKPQVSDILERQLRQLEADGVLRGVLRVGDLAPPFELYDSAGSRVSSKDLLAKGPLVLSFFRGTWCPYCNQELLALNEIDDDIRKAGATLLVLSPERSESVEAMRRDHGITYPILRDANSAVATLFGLSYTFSDELKQLYLDTFKTNIAEINGEGGWQLPVPARFIIDTDHRVKYAQANPDYRFRPEPADTLDKLEKLVHPKN